MNQKNSSYLNSNVTEDQTSILNAQEARKNMSDSTIQHALSDESSIFKPAKLLDQPSLAPILDTSPKVLKFENISSEGYDEFLALIHKVGKDTVKSLYDKDGLEWSDYLSTEGAAFAMAFGKVVNALDNPNKIWDSTGQIAHMKTLSQFSPLSNAVSKAYFPAAVGAAQTAYDVYVNEKITTEKQFAESLTDVLTGVVGGTLAADLGTKITAGIGVAGLGAEFVIGSVFVLGLTSLYYAGYSKAKADGLLDPLYDLTESALNAFYDSLLAPPVNRDPLTLDLNGDGIDFTESAYFDHQGNGIANKSEWISPEDGFLTLDRNKNGIIDNGTELFGDNTDNGQGDKSENGYQALKVFDVNSDNVINSEDEIHSQLKIWMDKNSDGISQESELFTLDDLDISSIDLEHEDLQSTFTDSQGETHQTKSVTFEVNTFDRKFISPIEVPQEISVLPNIKGMGTVRDLHQAMTLSEALKAHVEAFAASPERSEQILLTEKIIDAWAKTSDLYDRDIPESSAWEADQLHIIESFYGAEVPWDFSLQRDRTTQSFFKESTHQAYISLFKEVYFGLVSQTRLKDYYDDIKFDANTSSTSFSLDSVIERIKKQEVSVSLLSDVLDFSSTLKGADQSDVAELYQYITDSMSQISSNALDELKPALELNSMMNSYDESNNTVHGDEGDNKLFGLQTDDILDGKEGNDFIFGGDGYDNLKGSEGNDYLFGGAGKDTLSVSYSGSNTLDGGAGNDILQVNTYRYGGFEEASLAKNKFIGGLGSDQIIGGLGSDTYVFNLGDGNDTITDEDFNDSGEIDQIQFGAGITLDDLSLRRDGEDMLILIAGNDSSDSITIKNTFRKGNSQELNERYQIEYIDLVDGTSIYPLYLPLTVLGTNDDDKLYGSDGVDIVYGHEGRDVLYSADGDDHLYGGAGNDQLEVSSWGSNILEGGKGNDVLKIARNLISHEGVEVSGLAQNKLIGGQGADRLEGGVGSETYIFNIGDGHDVIEDYDYASVGSIDRIQLGAGITKEMLGLRREKNNMVLFIGGTDSKDTITIENIYKNNMINPIYAIESIELQDGTSFSLEELSMSILGTNDDDILNGTDSGESIYGYEGRDTIDGGQGNDTLYGGAGKDKLTVSWAGSNVLHGGAGHDLLKVERSTDDITNRFVASQSKNTFIGGKGIDRLEGSVSQDTYVFNIDDGHDVINDYDRGSLGQTDCIEFGEGITQQALKLYRKSKNIILYINGVDSGDLITIENIYDSNSSNKVNHVYSIENIKFHDGSLIPFDSLHLTIEGTAKDDELYGTNISETIYGHEGRDILEGYHGDDHLFGGEGKDELSVGFQGSNVLDGGEGNDKLQIKLGNNDFENIYLASHAKNVLIGGRGDDTFKGGTGSETYVFYLGDGHDVIEDKDKLSLGRTDRIQFGEGIDKEDLLFCKDDSDLVVMIHGSDSRDSIRIKKVFNGHSIVKANCIEQIEFADGTTMSTSEVLISLMGSNDDDNLEGTNGNDHIYGQEGRDTLNGGYGNDHLSGGNGKDKLYVGFQGSNTLDGGAGDDHLEVKRSINSHQIRYVARHTHNTLIGGTGDDYLKGGSGSETYVFNMGDGHDVIDDYDELSLNQKDRIQLGKGINRNMLSLDVDGDDMKLFMNGPNSGDSILISKMNSDSRYKIEEILLNDGTILSPLKLPNHETLVQSMSAFDNESSEVSYSDTIIDQNKVLPTLVTQYSK